MQHLLTQNAGYREFQQLLKIVITYFCKKFYQERLRYPSKLGQKMAIKIDTRENRKYHGKHAKILQCTFIVMNKVELAANK